MTVSFLSSVRQYIPFNSYKKIDQMKKQLTQTVARFGPIITVFYSMNNGDKLTQGSVLAGLGAVLVTPRTSKEKTNRLERNVQVAIYTVGLSFATMHCIEKLAQTTLEESHFAQQAVAIQTGKTVLATGNALINLSRSTEYEMKKESNKFVRSLAFLVPTMVSIGSSVILIGSSVMQFMQKDQDLIEEEEMFQTIGVITAFTGIFLAQKCTEHFVEKKSHLFD